MVKTVIDRDVAEIQKNINSKNMIIGTDESLKALRNGRLAKVFLTSNCPSNVKADFEHYAKLSNVEVINLPIPNDELSIVCKKPFSISVVGFSKV
jgi:large subunit ribosomal protein L30e